MWLTLNLLRENSNEPINKLNASLMDTWQLQNQNVLNVVTENVQKFLIGHDTEPCRSLVANVTIINNSLQDVGKDGKLQLLLCLAVRYEV